MLIMLGRPGDAIGWLEQAYHIVRQIPPSQVAARDSNDYTIENIKSYLAAAYAYTGRVDEGHSLMASVLASRRFSIDFTVRRFLQPVDAYFNAEQRAQEERLAEGLRRAGLPDHLDEMADFHIASTSSLQDRLDSPTPLDLPGATTITTAEMQRLLQTTPKLLVLTTSPTNPSIPGAIQVVGPGGRLDDEWQAAIGTLVERATNEDKAYPIVTFAYSINHWQARNLAVRLLALGYKHVYWYRGGWEAWDSHGVPMVPLTVRFSPPMQPPPVQTLPVP
jgi:hypothetical protein